MARRTIDFHLRVAVDEDAMRALEDDDPHAWLELLGSLSTAVETIVADNLDPAWTPDVTVGTGPTGIEYW